MIGIHIKYKGNSLFTELPKDIRELEDELSSIGLNVYPQSIKLSDRNDFGYEIKVFAQDSVDMEVASRICRSDNIGQLNSLMAYIAKNDQETMRERICGSHTESIAELYEELTAPPKLETGDKIVIKTCLNHKSTYYEPSECMVEKAISLPTADFQELLDDPMNSYDFITENRMCMYSDENEVNHCLLVYDENSGDGLLINAEGYDYARYSAYIPNARELLDLKQSGLQTVKAPITNSEKRLLDVISIIADRIETFVHLGNRDFNFEDILEDLDYSFDDLKEIFIHAAAEKLSAKPDIGSVEVSELGIPFQPEITVITTEETEDLTAENEISGLSF